MWLFKKRKVKTTPEPEVKTTSELEEPKKEVEIVPDNKKTVNDLMKQVTDREYVTVSPLDGEYMSVIRSEDVMAILCEYFNVNGKETEYSDYA